LDDENSKQIKRQETVTASGRQIAFASLFKIILPFERFKLTIETIDFELKVQR